ncbi:ribonuclease D [Acuticoccus yangtzensis]|uniref:ribonuclease D n=1 Tax=Acuticoccus yangtzensis TaxID=1443441 RepID=UPI0009499CE1|nr:ribonuclease D [Acuticoccus yangtzensis]ORE91199.1 3'-5' exonuclease [Stappia sp. 22II-S9-Z10]
MTITLHHGDLPEYPHDATSIAIDTEAMGLQHPRDRLCLVQLSRGDGNVDLVKIARGQTAAPNLTRLLADPAIEKLFHYGRFDMGILAATFGVMAAPVYCTKIASRLVRTYTDRHGLRELAREVAGEDISKQQQSSDWGADTLTDAQMAYAASDVLHLHKIRIGLDAMLEREGRTELAQQCFAFLPTRVALDLAGWPDIDIFAHS